MISDPVAAQYVVQTSGYGFIRPSDRKEVSRQLLGRGILTVEGQLACGAIRLTRH